MKSLLVFALVALLIIPALSLAATPQLVSVHGKLTDTLNNPYSGNKNFIFRIYTASSGGSPLYTEFWNTSSQQVSLAYGGYFSVLLGSQTALTLPFDQQYWLEISIEGETLSPRYRLGSTPYTYRANITDNLAANANASGTLNMNSQSITNAAWLNATNINVSSNAYFGGNVGIGTASPSDLLTVGSGSAASNKGITINGGTNAGNGGGLQFQRGGSTIGWVGPESWYFGNTNNNNNTIIASTNNLSFFTNGAVTPSIYITTSGYVGIGTTAPANGKLQVTDGRIAITGNNVVLDLRPNSGEAVVQSAANGNSLGLYGTDNISLYTLGGGWASKMFIASGGNVGIGTAGPGTLLEVSAADSSNQLRVRRTGSSLGYGDIYANSNGLNIVGGGGANVLLNPAGGNVGIGTAIVGANLNISNAAQTACSYINAGSTSFTACSSRDIKENIKPFAADNILGRIASVPVNTYDFKNCTSEGCRNNLGLIAEDFQTVLNRGNGKTVNGQDVQMALWLGVQQLIKENQQSQEQISQLKSDNDALKSIVCLDHPATPSCN